MHGIIMSLYLCIFGAVYACDMCLLFVKFCACLNLDVFENVLLCVKVSMFMHCACTCMHYIMCSNVYCVYLYVYVYFV